MNCQAYSEKKFLFCEPCDRIDMDLSDMTKRLSYIETVRKINENPRKEGLLWTK